MEHGRLFTMGDVRQIVARARARGPSLEEIVEELDGKGALTFGADEPVLVVRAGEDTDRHALARRCEHAWDEMAEWRRARG